MIKVEKKTKVTIEIEGHDPIIAESVFMVDSSFMQDMGCVFSDETAFGLTKEYLEIAFFNLMDKVKPKFIFNPSLFSLINPMFENVIKDPGVRVLGDVWNKLTEPKAE